MTEFSRVYESNKEKLEMYVPVVARVHGPSHPEFYQVKEHYDALVAHIGGENNDMIGKEFESLKEVTNNYKVPEDTCESYQAVYEMLESLNRAYDQE